MHLSKLSDLFHQNCSSVDFASLRAVQRVERTLKVRGGVVEPPQQVQDDGYMVTVQMGAGCGYAATSDGSAAGIRAAFESARHWAELSARYPLAGLVGPKDEVRRGRYAKIGETPWQSLALDGKLARMRELDELLARGEFIVDREVALVSTHVVQSLLTSHGTEIVQEWELLTPSLAVTAHRSGVTEQRSWVGGAQTRQGGLELLAQLDEPARQLPEEARQLVMAPHCPQGVMDVILDPDQMILQIHESIGHPLELDRILGDERNYAGTSFVTPAMFGSYQYGSELLNVTFDPTCSGEVSSYAFDDDGTPAERVFLIRNGILERGIGGAISQARSGLGGTATSRATSWNRPPIDRMANLNLEAGTASMEELVGKVERGVYMRTNCSWSIDDSRNKFQFGCEYGQLIENGKLTKVVRKPNYRGISANFWRNLAAVGGPETVDVLGTPNCGKGEPNQAIHVGHATPACLFTGIDVFGGEQ